MKLRMVYEVEVGSRRFPMGYEFESYNFNLATDECYVFEDGISYTLPADACVELPDDGTLWKGSVRDMAEMVYDDGIVDYVKRAQEYGMYVDPGRPNDSTLISEKEVERLRKESIRENG